MIYNLYHTKIQVKVAKGMYALILVENCLYLKLAAEHSEWDY